MEKKYLKEELAKYEDKLVHLEAENKRIKTNNSKISSEYEDMEARLEEKQNECRDLKESNQAYAKKI